MADRMYVSASRQCSLAVATLMAFSFLMTASGGSARSGETDGVVAGGVKIRVGVYDNRAIAVAYAASQYLPVADKRKEHDEAKKAENLKRVKELEEWGKKHQRQLHRQGFGRAPVDDLLVHVKAKLPEAARKSRVDVIVWQCNYTGPTVEVVDVTKELVMLFDPTEKTLKTVEELLKHEPVDLDELDKHHKH